MAKNIAPGLSRTFACESWPAIPQAMWKEARKNAFAAIHTDDEPQIFASDISPAAIDIARASAEAAGVDDCIHFEAKPLSQLTLPTEYGVAISNPPYGERLGRMEEVQQLYANMGRVFAGPRWGMYVLTGDEFFEAAFGRRCNAKRKLFNGNIKTDYYQYHGQRPPR